MLENETTNRSFQACMAPVCMVVKQFFQVVLVLVIARIDSLQTFIAETHIQFRFKQVILLTKTDHDPLREAWDLGVLLGGVLLYLNHPLRLNIRVLCVSNKIK